MIFLILSIAMSSVINVVFRLIGNHQIDNQLAITVNYITCVITGLITLQFMGKPFPIDLEAAWFRMSVALGALFILVFMGMAVTAQRSGISVSVVAAKMGVVFPVIFALIYLGEPTTLLLLAGIILSLTSVYLIARKTIHGEKIDHPSMWLPFLVFLGSGTIDLFLSLVERDLPTGLSEVVPAILIFASAAAWGIVVMMIRLIRGRIRITANGVYAGILLGIPNFFSIYFVIAALHSGFLATSRIFPINNVGIVLLSTLISILFFKERLNNRNLIGLLFAVLSILLISGIFD
ncbi:MAG: EamA/RhaT family transporter [Flavobacteriales bacterium]|nr:EamA/RhaT family transporter [Bacteroidota bacterium]MCB9239644.1 EamA/RhaT family transporter [Flavobacteriales bacterium]